MAAKNLVFAGLADLYLKTYGVAGARRPIGSVSACTVSHEEETIKQRNYGREGGTLAVINRLDTVGVSLTLQSLSIANLAAALRGGVTSVVAGSVMNEVHLAYKGGLIRLVHMNPNTVVVTDVAGTLTYVAGTDYTVTGAGVVILESGTIAEASTVHIDYAYSARKVVEALTQGQAEYELTFDGINEAENNTNVTVDLHRLKFGLPSALNVISDEFVNMEVEGELILDPLQTGVGASKFYRWSYPGA